MKRWKWMILALNIILLFQVSLSVPLPVVATEVQTEVQTEQQTQTTEEQTQEDEKMSGNYNSKKTYGIDTEFDELTGDAKYLGSKFRQNYYLDLEKTGITEIADAAANGLANGLFTAIQMFAMVVCSIVYFCLEFSLAEAIAGFITELQQGLFGGVYQQLWLLAVVVMGVSIVGKMLKRALSEILKDLLMVVFVTIISGVMITHSATILTVSTNITKSVSNAIFTGLDTATGMDGGGSYASVAAGSLWVDMVHEPWKTLEFGSVDVDEVVVEEILSLKPKSSDRNDIVKDMTKETGCFEKSRAWGRLGMLICYIVPCLLKGVTFIAIGLLQFFGQILALFVLLLAAFVLVLAIIPSYGTSIIQKWLDKFLDANLSMMVLSFLMALLIWLNKLIFSFSGDFGWLICLVFQAVVCILLFMNYRTILFMLLHPRDGMSEMNRMMRQMQRRGGSGGGRGRGGSRRRRSGYDEYEDDDYEDDYYEDYDDDYYDDRQPYQGQGQQQQYGGSGQIPYDGSYRNDSYNPYYSTDNEYAGDPKYQDYDESREHGLEQNTEPVEKADYSAIRNAPTQQEIYDMFNDDRSEGEIRNSIDWQGDDRSEGETTNSTDWQGNESSAPKEPIELQLDQDNSGSQRAEDQRYLESGNGEVDSGEVENTNHQEEKQNQSNPGQQQEPAKEYIELANERSETEERPEITLAGGEQTETRPVPDSAGRGTDQSNNIIKEQHVLRADQSKEAFTLAEDEFIEEPYATDNISAQELADSRAEDMQMYDDEEF